MGFYGLAASLCVAAVIAAFGIGYGKGSASRNSEIAEYQAAIKASEIVAKEAADRADKATAREVIVYRDKVKVIEKRIPGEVQLIETIRETSNCPVPVELIQLWNGEPAPGSGEAQPASGVDGAAFTLAEVAEAAAEAKRRFEVNAAKLESLQSLIRSQSGNDHQ